MVRTVCLHLLTSSEMLKGSAPISAAFFRARSLARLRSLQQEAFSDQAPSPCSVRHNCCTPAAAVLHGLGWSGLTWSVGCPRVSMGLVSKGLVLHIGVVVLVTHSLSVGWQTYHLQRRRDDCGQQWRFETEMGRILESKRLIGSHCAPFRREICFCC